MCSNSGHPGTSGSFLNYAAILLALSARADTREMVGLAG
jgi:hypothetical protein